MSVFKSRPAGARKAGPGAVAAVAPGTVPAAVVCDNVSFTYPSSTAPALAGVSFAVGEGEFVYLVGSSGSGKSTLLRMLYAELVPATGRLQVAGVSLTRLRPARRAAYRRNLGVVFQDFKLLEGRTVYEQVAFALTVTGRRHEAPDLVPATLDLVGLAGKEDRLPTELSGGEQQRVAIARALVTRPRILVADEPTGNLDPVTSAAVMNVLERVNESGVAVVMATHDASLVDTTGHRVLVMDAGLLVRDSATGGYFTELPDPPTHLHLDATPVLGASTDYPAGDTVLLAAYEVLDPFAATPAVAPAIDQAGDTDAPPTGYVGRRRLVREGEDA